MSIKNKINKILRKLNVELHGLSYLQSLAKGDFKNNELDLFKRIFNEDKILIYDVGANRGLMIENYLTVFPNSVIHAFEAYPPYAEQLQLKYVKNSSIFVNNCGILDHIGEMTLNVNKSIDTSSFLSSTKTGLNSDNQVKTISQVKVATSTIDNYGIKNNNERIHILKLDIQGSELNALFGAKNLLKDKKIDFIFIETYFIEQYKNQPSFFDIANYLLPFGYVLQDLYNPIYGNGKLAWCDTLFMRNNMILQ